MKFFIKNQVEEKTSNIQRDINLAKGGFNRWLRDNSALSQQLRNSSLAILSALLLSACSVGMALNGQQDPDLSVLKKNMDRTNIEAQLGVPIQVEQARNGQIIAVYEYEVGREASAGRAVAHGVMDVLTLGIWEVVGTPIEVLKGDKIRLTVTYDKEGHFISATRSS